VILSLTAIQPEVVMARRKYQKQISNMHVETINDQDWSSFLKISKQEDSMRSAYVHKARISWTLDSDEGNDNPGMGFMFVVSTDNALNSTTPSENDGQIISASASRGGGGVVTLDIRRRITTNYDGADAAVLELLKGSGDAPIYLHAANLFLVVEVWGHFHETESL